MEGLILKWNTSNYESSVFDVKGSREAIFTQMLREIQVEGIDSGSFITVESGPLRRSISLRRVNVIKNHFGAIESLAFLIGSRTVLIEDSSFISEDKQPVYGHFALVIIGVANSNISNSVFMNLGGTLGGALYIGVFRI